MNPIGPWIAEAELSPMETDIPLQRQLHLFSFGWTSCLLNLQIALKMAENVYMTKAFPYCMSE